MNGNEGPEDARRQTRGPGRWIPHLSPATWLLLAVVIYFVVSFALSWLRSVELQTTTWDQGIYQQALWSTAHGRAFYETADVETGGYGSLLQVHTVFLLYLLVPLYAALPYQVTLFAVQSIVVAVAAIPLYLLSRDVTRSARLALVAAVAYLVWTPVLSSNLYDFHPESFLPVELFALVLLWERGRYWAGGAVAAVAFATIELAPVLVFFVGAFFLLPATASELGSRNDTDPQPSRDAGAGRLRQLWSSPRVRASAALVAVSVGAYYLLLYLRVDVLTTALGTSSLAAPPTGYVIGGTPAALGLAIQNLGAGFVTKVTYWVLILALLGFVPLLAPRALILAVPWFGFTMLSGNLNYVELGFQYGFIAAASLLVGFVYGLPRAVALLRALSGVQAAGSPDRQPAGRRVLSRWARRHVALGLFAVLVAVNLLLSPINPWMQNAGLGSAYQVTYSGAGEPVDVERVAGLIPSGATVVASDNLFPLVANDENAYSFLWTQDNFLGLPFNVSDPPQYVFLATDRAAAVPAWLATELYAPLAFGVRAVAWSSPAGPVLLFQSGYSGVSSTFGSPPLMPFSWTGATLVNSEAGYVTTIPGEAGPEVAASAPGTLGTFFAGPWTGLPAGNFSVRLSVHASSVGLAPSPSPSEPVLWLGASAFAQAGYVSDTLTYGALSTPGWVTETFNITVPGPSTLFAVQGVALATNAQVFLEEVDVAPS